MSKLYYMFSLIRGRELNLQMSPYKDKFDIANIKIQILGKYLSDHVNLYFVCK